jgi:hypothetical protein
MRSVEVAGPDGELVRVDAVPHANRPAVGPQAPGTLVHALHRRAVAAVVGCREFLDMPRELADQVAPRGPHRKDEIENVDRRELRFHLEQMRVGAGHRNAVADRFGHASVCSRNRCFARN